VDEAVRHGPGEGERYEDDVRVALIKGALPQLTVLEFDVFGDGYDGPDPHTHDDHTDSFLVLEGEVEFTAGDETVVLGPGGFISSPPGARHGFRSAGGRAKVLNLHTPGAGFIDGIRRTSAKST
jgi:quercetin dioxygenase-like cupin family protein